LRTSRLFEEVIGSLEFGTAITEVSKNRLNRLDMLTFRRRETVSPDARGELRHCKPET
jgi:hypothetical protein